MSERVYVYFNLHTKLWSVRATSGARRGRVIAHLSALCLRNCEARVNERARLRVIARQRREVHAGIVGELCEMPTERDGFERFSYNPYRSAAFHTQGGDWWRAEACLFDGRAAYVKGATL